MTNRRSRIVHHFLLWAATAVLARPGLSQSQVELRWGRVEPLIARLMERPDVAGMSIAVVDGYDLVIARSYGTRVQRAGARMTPNTLLQAASLSKVVTAVAALRLVERRVLALDEDVNRRLVSWKLPVGGLATGEQVTLGHLLSHTGGVNVEGFQGYAPDAALPNSLQILRGDAPANNPPIIAGEPPGRQRYSGGGYQVVQRVLEDVTGRGFDQFMHDEVFTVAGMDHSVFAVAPPPSLRAEVAEGHALQTSGELAAVTFQHPEFAAGGLWSTASDLGRLVAGLLRAWRGDLGQLLSPESVRGMMEPSGERRMGLGVMVRDSDEGRYFMHTGQNVGFRSLLLGFLETGQGVVLMFNAEVDRAVAMELVAAVGREFEWPRFSLR